VVSDHHHLNQRQQHHQPSYALLNSIAEEPIDSVIKQGSHQEDGLKWPGDNHSATSEYAEKPTVIVTRSHDEREGGVEDHFPLGPNYMTHGGGDM